MLHFDRNEAVSYWVCTIVPHSAVAIIVNIHAMCSRALNWEIFMFWRDNFFVRVFALYWILVCSHAFEPFDTRVIWRYMGIEFLPFFD